MASQSVFAKSSFPFRLQLGGFLQDQLDGVLKDRSKPLGSLTLQSYINVLANLNRDAQELQTLDPGTQICLTSDAINQLKKLSAWNQREQPEYHNCVGLAVLHGLGLEPAVQRKCEPIPRGEETDRYLNFHALLSE